MQVGSNNLRQSMLFPDLKSLIITIKRRFARGFYCVCWVSISSYPIDSVILVRQVLSPCPASMSFRKN